MNTPNKITITRFILTIILIAIMVFPYNSYNINIPYLGNTGFNVIDLVGCIIFIVASITDFIDGHLARKNNLVTDFGKFMDPLADKFLVNSSLIILAVQKSNLLPVLIVVLMIGRDIAVDGIKLISAKKGRTVAANIYGKLKTVFQMIAIPVIFLNGFPFNYLLKENTYIITIILASLACLMSLISGVIYIYQNRDMIKEAK
ncbi:MAG TPA: CDP-diacylglycerol--glycerol-3-phosphate 3-phosphatidyltransferase [Firmicutes bacterium]|jgi:CDP-diacylglycerol--glycerol-3-phosphate 3-phosphatidyltransferase|nr:cDP-diacylglycerol/glycerol-3-phosphate 3-phosphatidyltransferase [Clostridium sp. CAG:288]HAR47748.1 CDP-diacylglycerol--glycerol-3-phosphate 3-phosphatidyltransferase [Bacillota bacterium]HAX00656.1 CDP-diacylglycerol--glycerol-3-phosphate 3-phosphatidyltransferase [Bacillota bacterium]